MSLILTTREKKEFQEIMPLILDRGIDRADLLCRLQNNDFDGLKGEKCNVPFCLLESGDGIEYTFNKKIKGKKRVFKIKVSFSVLVMDDIIFQEYLNGEKKIKDSGDMNIMSNAA